MAVGVRWFDRRGLESRITGLYTTTIVAAISLRAPPGPTSTIFRLPSSTGPPPTPNNPASSRSCSLGSCNTAISIAYASYEVAPASPPPTPSNPAAFVQSLSTAVRAAAL
ncbi:uncharacterized protein LOC143344933 [Colletes latitarsis]|uniref:uncharacterized protein LOC143344933 n=1 Tax=Colletes latitarsis TaxID=2605962 RepID=UPI004035D4E9